MENIQFGKENGDRELYAVLEPLTRLRGAPVPDETGWFYVLPGDVIETAKTRGTVQRVRGRSLDARANGEYHAIILTEENRGEVIPASKITKVDPHMPASLAYVEDIVDARGRKWLVLEVGRDRRGWMYNCRSIDNEKEKTFRDRHIEIVDVLQANAELKGFRDYQVRRRP